MPPLLFVALLIGRTCDGSGSANVELREGDTLVGTRTARDAIHYAERALGKRLWLPDALPSDLELSLVRYVRSDETGRLDSVALIYSSKTGSDFFLTINESFPNTLPPDVKGSLVTEGTIGSVTLQRIVSGLGDYFWMQFPDRGLRVFSNGKARPNVEDILAVIRSIPEVRDQ